MNQTTFTRGPVAWQQFGDYCLTGQYGMRPIILSAHKGKLKLRDAAKDLLIAFDPRHPDAALIVIAFNAATAAQDMGYDGQKAIEALPKLLAGAVNLLHEGDILFKLAEDAIVHDEDGNWHCKSCGNELSTGGGHKADCCASAILDLAVPLHNVEEVLAQAGQKGDKP